MSNTFAESQKNTNDLYRQLTKIADDIVKKNSTDLDKTIKEIENNIENITNDDIRKYILKLASITYYFGDKVEHSDLKKNCANALLKETTAREFAINSGSVASRQNEALINTSNETAVNMLYGAVAGQLKVKLQLANKMLDSLKNVLISRNADAKIQNELGYGVNVD